MRTNITRLNPSSTPPKHFSIVRKLYFSIFFFNATTPADKVNHQIYVPINTPVTKSAPSSGPIPSSNPNQENANRKVKIAAELVMLTAKEDRNSFTP